MAEQHRLDVWLVKANRVYRNVPYAAVADKVQQGHVLPDDKIRAAGTTDWHRIADDLLLSPYLPRPEPFRAEDRAEALERVEVGFSWKQPRENEEEIDPDMIPLIDISLVLLIFFLMASGGLIAASVVETPAAQNARLRAIKPRETVTVSMTKIGGQVQYYFEDQSSPLDEQELLNQVGQKIQEGTVVEAVVKANPWIPYEKVRELLIGLERVGVKRIQAGVHEKRSDEEK